MNPEYVDKLLQVDLDRDLIQKADVLHDFVFKI